jgi:hypothetical protein
MPRLQIPGFAGIRLKIEQLDGRQRLLEAAPSRLA